MIVGNKVKLVEENNDGHVDAWKAAGIDEMIEKTRGLCWTKISGRFS
jgi:hypothetical protein